MKKLLLTLSLLTLVKISIAQLQITGTIKNAKVQDAIEINFSRDGNYWPNNSVHLKPNKAGNFQFRSSERTAKFAILVYKEIQQYILLSPNRPLHVNINTQSPNPFSFSGHAKPENNLIVKLHLSNVSDLPFIKELKAKNSYATWSVDSVIQIKLPQVMHSLDSSLNYVNRSAVPPAFKSLIAAEVKYQYAHAVADKIGAYVNNRKNRKDFHLRFIDSTFKLFKAPAKNERDRGLYANIYLDNYAQFKAWQAFYPYTVNPDKQLAKQALKTNSGIDFDELMENVNASGEKYAFNLAVKNIMPQYAWEKQLSNLMFNFSMSGQLQLADRLLHFMKNNCTDKGYIAAAEQLFLPLKKARDQYAHNLNIRIRPDYKTANSLANVLQPYKGKVVLIDMWFTQCPPCIAELKYTPALKERFKNDDVVFLNIARESDKDDEVWRDFIFINNMTGEHIRKTDNEIKTLWNELGIPDKDQAYPRYFIIDKNGNIADNNAKRPSDGEALYKDLEAALIK
ncbi:TlpA family protein disulfide reductase [Mucilaginibacter sp. HD30]